MIGRILVATDGSDKAREAVALAATVAKAFDARLTILHVVFHGLKAEEASRLVEAEHLLGTATTPRSVQMPKSIEGLLSVSAGDVGQMVSVLGDYIVEEAAENARRSGAMQVDTRVEPGEYADNILAVAEEIDADMIVVGSRGLGRLAGLFLGSVSHKIVQHARCTVLVVR